MGETGEPADRDYLYDAFISYRHVERDRIWAEWLIEALEGFRTPKSLVDKGLPPRLRKVFRDEDELPSSADLNDQIKRALVGSRFLIVVCSAFTPRSKWVAREIEIFNELGRGDQVLALLTEGEPSDSFPSAMLVRRAEVIRYRLAALAYSRDPAALPDNVRSYFEARWDNDSNYEIASMGGLPHGWSYDMLENVDTRVMLLELPTSRMFGWQWGDVNNVVLSLPVDGLRRNIYRGVRCDITN